MLLGCIGAVALMLLTGYAGQISLGHAGLLAAGAFTTGILFKEFGAHVWVTLPASAALGALLGLVFGVPSLRLRGLYLAVSTLALHFIVIFLGAEYETKRGFSTGIVVESPIGSARTWYFVLLGAAAATLLLAFNLLRSRTGRAWRAIHGREAVAEARHQRRARQALRIRCLFDAHRRGGLPVRLLPRLRLGGGLFALSDDPVRRDDHHRRHGLLARGGARHGIRGAFSLCNRRWHGALGLSDRLSSVVFAVNYTAFGVVMILFLVFEPQGLVGIWRRVQNWFLLWPFKQKPLS